MNFDDSISGRSARDTLLERWRLDFGHEHLYIIILRAQFSDPSLYICMELILMTQSLREEYKGFSSWERKSGSVDIGHEHWYIIILRAQFSDPPYIFVWNEFWWPRVSGRSTRDTLRERWSLDFGHEHLYINDHHLKGTVQWPLHCIYAFYGMNFDDGKSINIIIKSL